MNTEQLIAHANEELHILGRFALDQLAKADKIEDPRKKATRILVLSRVFREIRCNIEAELGKALLA